MARRNRAGQFQKVRISKPILPVEDDGTTPQAAQPWERKAPDDDVAFGYGRMSLPAPSGVIRGAYRRSRAFLSPATIKRAATEIE